MLLAVLAVLASPCIQAGPAYVEDEVLVRFAEATPPLGVRRALAGRPAAVTVAPGLTKVRLRPGETVDQAIAELGAQPGVAYVQPNYIKRIQRIPDDPHFELQWGLRNTGQPVPDRLAGLVQGAPGADVRAATAWDTTTGAGGVVVALIDSGVDTTHPDLAGNFWANGDEVPDNGRDDDGNGYVDDTLGWDMVHNDAQPQDLNGHGTYVAGVLAGRGDNGTAIAGVAWNVALMVLRAFDENGIATTADIVEAVDYAVANGARVINASYGAQGGTNPGTQDFDRLEYESLQRANEAGVLVVAAACNDHADNDRPETACVPASYDLPNIIAVAATTPFDELSVLSNYGANSVDLGAPGEGIVTIAPSLVPVWAGPRSLSSATPLTGIDLSGQEHCRMEVDYASTLLAGAHSLLFDVQAPGGDWVTVGGAVLQGSNFFGRQVVYVDISDFAGVADLAFRARLFQGEAPTAAGAPIGDALLACYGRQDLGVYYHADGTSMAAPFVTGAAALLLARNGTLDAAALRAAILDNVDPLEVLSGLVRTGGRLNIARAVAAVDLAQTQSSGADTGGEPSSAAGAQGQGGGGGVFGPLLLLSVGVRSTLKRYGQARIWGKARLNAQK